MDHLDVKETEELTDDELNEVLGLVLKVAGPTPEETEAAKQRLCNAVKEAKREVTRHR